MPKIYALLVGINAYPAPIKQLSGCLNDIENARSYIEEAYPGSATVVLKDGDATRANVIDQFRRHLSQAGRDDVAMFQYCGHGARSTSALEFNKFDLDLHDEGIVLVDSRLRDDTFDLADKELAILISELSAKNPHIALVLDCCHSGSGTRDLASRPAVVRNTTGKFPPRPIESYLEGQYAAMVKAGTVNIPNGRHILLAACDRSQTAKEDSATHAGYFTTALYDVLRRSGPLTYPELFVRSRAVVRERIRSTGDSDQDPQFEPMDGFDSYQGAFGAAANTRRQTYLVSRGADDWRVELGAIEGMPADPAQPVTMILHPDTDPNKISGTARVTSVGAQTSVVQLDFTPSDPAQHFMAEITSMPQAPMLVAYEGDVATRQKIEAALDGDPTNCAHLVEAGADDGFALITDGASVALVQRDTGTKIRSAAIVAGSTDWADRILDAIRHVAQWRRSLTLANPHPKLDPDMVDFKFVEHRPDGSEQVHPDPDFQLEAAHNGDSWDAVKGELRIRNRTGQMLNYVLVHFSNDYGVQALMNEQIVPGDDFQTILIPSADGTGDPVAAFSLDGGRETIENLKLILSTERVDDFLLELDPLTDTRGFGSAADADAVKPVTDDWFTKDLHAHIVPQLDVVGAQPVTVAGGQVTIGAHPSVTATVSLSTASGPVRGISDEAAFVNRLNAIGLTLPGIGGERGDSPNILQLTDISNPDELAKAPLTVSLDVPLGEGEVLVPLVNDGGHVMLAGDVWRDDAGKTQVQINSLPANPVAQRGIGSALWMYLCKAYFKSDHVNRLRWVEKTADGTASHTDGLEGKVAAAKSVLLVIHGIIGDSAPIAKAVLDSGIAGHFDLVLSYDYENLSTSIDDTAKALQEDLRRVGLSANDDKRLVILAHSMGGLVARCFVEKEGGAAVADRLVLCGTPNAGSPFGEVEPARQIMTILATLALNVPALAPLCAPALAVLTFSKKLTPTLEEMAPHSPFISTLFADEDAGVPITILAGDIDKYQDEDQRFFGELLVKLGRGPALDALFDSGAHDLAAAVDSIRASASPPLAKATRIDVACHHLNYFQCDAGISALKSLDWTA